MKQTILLMATFLAIEFLILPLIQDIENYLYKDKSVFIL